MDEKLRLSSSEWKIISLLWENEPMTIMQITAALSNETGWTKHTVITLLKRMEDKKAVSFDQIGNAKHYYPLIKREDVAVSETRSFLQRLYRGSIGMMVNSMIMQNALSKEDIDELYDILKKAESDKDG
ncbi:MAG: BlaI/MecI/CopY family transcriptional regulator [Huintestinicola sp.]